jgi:hypothetical protein
MGGYTIKANEVERAADALGSVAFYASNADSDITAITGLPAPAAGDGIGAALTSFKAQWNGVLPDLHKEVDTLSGKVTSSATVTIQVEQQVHSRFQQFAE